MGRSATARDCSLPSTSRRPVVCAGRRLVVQHADGRRVEVIELAAPSAGYEREDSGEYDERRERDNDEDDAHDAVSFGNVVLSQDASTTVSELAGMSIAAMSGVMTPVTASVAPTML